MISNEISAVRALGRISFAVLLQLGVVEAALCISPALLHAGAWLCSAV